MSGGQPNFYLWGAWKSKTIREPFLTMKVASELKKVVLGESFIIALKDSGIPVSWGWDKKHGCLGLGSNEHTSEIPREIEVDKNDKKETVTDIQMGQDHVMALTRHGAVYCWGKGFQGQLGNGGTDNQWKPTKVGALESEQIVQIAAVKNSSFALTASGNVYGWGDNTNNMLGLEECSKNQELTPVRLSLLAEQPVRKLEIFEGRTIIAHVRSQKDEQSMGMAVAQGADLEDPQFEIFQGIDELRKAMEMTQELWNHLVRIKHGGPYDTPGTDTGMAWKRGTIQDDLNIDEADLIRAERHIGALFDKAIQALKATQSKQGTKNVKLILCMFIDECLLRREKVQQAIVARKFADAKKARKDISAYSVTDFGANANEEIRKIIAVTKELQTMLEEVQKIVPVDMMSQQLKLTLTECLESKLQLHDTRIELLKAAEAKHSDAMLPALRIIKDRWNALKKHSIYAMYKETLEREEDFRNDDERLKDLVWKSNTSIDEMLLLLDKDKFISHDTLVPALCYDLLRENAELRKMNNKYQLHVLMIHEGFKISNPCVAKGKMSGGASSAALGSNATAAVEDEDEDEDFEAA